MPTLTDQQLMDVGLEANCSNLCATGRLVKNVGLVRMQVMVNDYCPFVGIRKHFEQFKFNASTFAGLPDSISSQFSIPSGGLDGICLREVFIRRSNLMFVKGTTAGTGSSSTSDDATTDQLVYPTNTVVANLWDNGKHQAKKGFEYVPHYAWTHSGSLFTNQIIEPDTYTGITQGSSSNAGSNASAGGNGAGSSGFGNSETDKNNLAKWNYITVNTPVSTQAGASSSDPQILYPVQDVSGIAGIGHGVHWSCEKRRPVYKQTDFFLTIKRPASESTNQSDVKPLLKAFAPLDVNLGNTAVKGAGVAVNEDGALINAGVVQVDENGNIVEDSRNLLDFNNQVYFIIEIGQHDANHNYFIILAEKTNPVLVHVSTVPVLVTQPDGSTKVVTPSVPVSRQLDVYQSATGAQLLSQPELFIRVKNYLGNLVVIFSGYEDTPWIIQRTDLVTASTAAGSSSNASVASGAASSSSIDSSDPNDYVSQVVPMVVPNANLALHGGNVKVSFNWGYQKYTDQITITMPQTLQIEGTKASIPTKTDVNLYLQNISGKFRITTPQNDAVYSQDALSFVETVAGVPQTTTAIEAQPITYRSYGKGCVPSQSSSGSSVSTDSVASDFTWPTQEMAIPPADMSSITVAIVGDLKAVANTGMRVKEFSVSIGLKAGDFTFGPDSETVSNTPCKLVNVITPICTGYVLFINATGCAWIPQFKDISPYVVSFNETWQAQDFVKIEHTGTLKLFINKGMMPVAAPVVDSVGDGQLPPVTAPIADLSDYIASLHDKHFYVRIKVWYQQSGVFPMSEPTNNAYIFTGICTGSTINYGTNERTMECNLVDLMVVLQEQIFVNSPFFDAVRDYVAVHEILHMAGFNDGSADATCTGSVSPASFVLQGMTQGMVSDSFPINFLDGTSTGLFTNRVYCQSFALPGAYEVLTNPVFRFKDGDNFLDAIVRMAKVASKCVYFDRFGIMHYENRVDTLLTANQLTEQQVLHLSKESFFASPQMVGCAGYGQVAYNTYSWQRLAGDVMNQIMFLSASPSGAFLVGGDKNYDLIDSPTTTGFVGYTKQFLQMNGVFGSDNAVKAVVSNYTTMYQPPLHVTFETFGRSYLKALDIITFTGIDSTTNNNGQAQPLRILNISTEIVAAPKNIWWSKIDAEWIYPGNGVNWGQNSGNSTDNG